MINNEFFIDCDSWNGELYLKVTFPINIEKVDELLSEERGWRSSGHPELPFCIESSNVKDKKRFLKTSKAKDSIRINPSFANKGTVTEQQCISWFTKGEKQTRYLKINTNNGLFGNWDEKRKMMSDIKKTKDCTKLIERLLMKGLNISDLSMTGPKFTISENKSIVKFKIEKISIEDLVEKCDKNDSKIKMISKFILGRSYQYRFLDYDI